MKDLDFLRFRKDSIVLDEADADLQDLLGKTSTFREVVERDCEFFGRAGIIDYSLLLGKINTVSEVSGQPDIESLYEKIAEDPSLGHGVFVTQKTDNKPPEAYVIAIIDPLTGFT